jgi:hypothetical protein
MGLDVTAYNKLNRLNVKTRGDGALVDAETGEEIGAYCYVSNPEDFLDRAATLENGGYYAYSQSMAFPAGSYGTYNDWRNRLAALAGYPQVNGRHDEGAWVSTQGPFWELINFSDSEGTIDSVVAAKLLRDFEEFDAKAQTRTEDFYLRFSFWKRAFALAADGGAVRFH